jgi:ABC-type lipoprotein export system ATPase subunit
LANLKGGCVRVISVNNLYKEFKNTDGSITKVLNGITYEVGKGEKIVIVGPSGSGKSTFLRCLNLLERPTSGEIYFDAQEITDPKININKIRQRMGMVFQNFNLFNNLTVMDNIILAPACVVFVQPLKGETIEVKDKKYTVVKNGKVSTGKKGKVTYSKSANKDKKAPKTIEYAGVTYKVKVVD